MTRITANRILITVVINVISLILVLCLRAVDKAPSQILQRNRIAKEAISELGTDHGLLTDISICISLLAVIGILKYILYLLCLKCITLWRQTLNENRAMFADSTWEEVKRNALNSLKVHTMVAVMILEVVVMGLGCAWAGKIIVWLFTHVPDKHTLRSEL
ncbi:hypothetical protein DL98DRAFT_579955 [Cadophora sp. DSE1049]|nr:hypothetical protein DL98DRAFT_579955 [Cadophora sp. DSE1049]